MVKHRAKLGELEALVNFDFFIANSLEDLGEKRTNIALMDHVADPLVRRERPGPGLIAGFKKNIATKGLKTF
jgi:hypothetical protein